MIGFNALGRMGRLCNQMFQYAALKGLAKNAVQRLLFLIMNKQLMMVWVTCLGLNCLILLT